MILLHKVGLGNISCNINHVDHGSTRITCTKQVFVVLVVLDMICTKLTLVVRDLTIKVRILIVPDIKYGGEPIIDRGVVVNVSKNLASQIYDVKVSRNLTR